MSTGRTGRSDHLAGARPAGDSPIHRSGSSAAPGHRTAARLVLGRLARLRSGRLDIRLPDGTLRTFGGPSGAPVADIAVHRWSFFSRFLIRGDIGAGESYVDGDWSTSDLVGLVRFFIANERQLEPPKILDRIGVLRDRLLHRARFNRQAQARRNIRAHYDLDNRFYALFLDSTMTYSAAVFEGSDQDLERAQLRKYERMAAAASLRPGDHVLEIGCGWGGFAELAAAKLGCRVTAITLSEEQARFARGRIRRRGLSDLVEVRLVDYRAVTGIYDAIVSIEMLEAVGHSFLGTFFAACDRLLRPGGRVAIQTIAIPDQLYDRYRRGTDWIRTYIFPGGHLPSLGAIQTALARRTSLTIERLDDIGSHYATTLAHWRRRFWRRVDDVRTLGFDDRFVRMWDFYLGTCEAAFRSGKLADLQLALVRNGDNAPTTTAAEEPAP